LVLAPLLFMIGTLSTISNVIQVVLVSYLIGVLMMTQESPTSLNRGFLPNWLFVDHCLIFGVFLVECSSILPIIFSIICVAMVSLMLYLHVLVKTTNPGILDDTAGSEQAVGESERPICTVCNIVRPERSKHCKTCNFCVKVMDHHCPVMDCCIGAGNHALFVGYLMVAVINASVMLICYSYLVDEYSFLGAAALSRCIMWSVPTSSLLFLQVYQISVNITTNEQMNRGREHYEYLSNWSSSSSQLCLMKKLYVNWRDFIIGDREKVE
jgi:hypothetical protein